MPDWAINGLIMLAVQGMGVFLMNARMSAMFDERLSNLKEDVKDMQRTKLDASLHDANCKKVEIEIRHVDHKINGVSQRVAGLESVQRSRP